MPLVSIVTPSFNTGAFIEATIQSVELGHQAKLHRHVVSFDGHYGLGPRQQLGRDSRTRTDY